MSENYLDVAVLGNVAQCTLRLKNELLDIVIAHKGRKLCAKIALLAPQVADLVHSGRQHIGLAKPTQRAFQKTLLTLTPHSRHTFDPIENIEVALRVAESHKRGEESEIILLGRTILRREYAPQLQN